MKILLRLAVLYFVFVLGVSRADSSTSTLTIKPNRCIGLQQGQMCFATLKFSWTTPATGEYCLFDERFSTPLLCWIGHSKQRFTQQFKSDANVNYEIRLKTSEEPLAQALVKISWVYKSNNSSTSRWRLF